MFTHAHIAPRNIMVDKQNNITGILDWGWAEWYPEYWEYAQILRPAFWGDWSVWMEKTAPQGWILGNKCCQEGFVLILQEDTTCGSFLEGDSDKFS